jgi:N-acetylglucosaminyl-diphospho-decaprenol L-rhamnosyltransferase
MTAQVSCLIPCYHRAKMLRAALERLHDPRIELVVVNAERDPDVAEAVASVAGAIEVPRDGSGFAAGVNAGMAHVTTEYVVCMNDDILIDPDAVLALTDPLAGGLADATVPAIATPNGELEPTIRALPTPGLLFREWFLFPERRVGALARAVHVEKWRRPAATEPIEAAGTPVIATTSALLRELPLPEDYFLNWDEMEWFWLLRERGKRVLYLPGIQAVHLGGGQQEISAFRSRLLTQNAVRFVRRTQGPSAARRAFAVMALYNLRLVVVALLRRAVRGAGHAQTLHARVEGLKAVTESWRETK